MNAPPVSVFAVKQAQTADCADLRSCDKQQQQLKEPTWNWELIFCVDC